MIYLSLGTNLEPRRKHLEQAKIALNKKGHTIIGKSFIFETPALLPLHATNEWQKNFLNQTIAIKTNVDHETLLKDIKSIEQEFGREKDLRWSPRPIDIDILLFHDQKVETENLEVPHKGLKQRSFFLRPLLDLAKELNDSIVETYSASYHSLNKPLPIWMYILNLTPDSFAATGGDRNYLQEATAALEDGAHIIDVGAESTRRNATALSHHEEWQRLEPYLTDLIHLCHSYEAKISVDTYHPETMLKAISLGVDYINDVSGLSSPEAMNIFLESKVEWIAMHNLGLPANPKNILAKEQAAHLQVKDWIENLNIPDNYKHRLTIDPGIGFGKDAVQSRDILANINTLKSCGYPILIGHSRKSFLTGMTSEAFKDRDLETIALSLRLATDGVDILRIHNMTAHRRAILSYNA